MAVMQNSLIFGDVNSADYGIYISGEGVFNAPKRDVEMISIPGRNGTFTLDKGRFENIEVTYPAITFEPGDYDAFARNLADFRNAICSLRGYQRLTDTFHPEEYRMATYIGGLDIKPIKYNTASQFNLVFDCKPQRYLMSGEAAIEVSDGDTLMNPTLFESSPLLEVEGYGSINFNNYMIELENATMGNIVLAGAFSFASADAVINISPGSLNAGDTISIEFLLLEWMIFRNDSSATSIGVDSTSDSATGVTTDMSGTYGHNYYTVFPRVSFINGTSSTLTNTTTVNGHYNTTNFTATIITTISYDATANTITINRTASNVPNQVKLTFSNSNSNVGETSGDSTKLVLGNPTYIDCEIGEAYRIESSGEVISLNQYIDLGSDLPKLEKGENLFALDNTITSLKVKPRWWKV